MGAFTLGQGGVRGEDLSANHLTQWLEKDSEEDWHKIYHATNICNCPPVGLRVIHHSDNPSWAVPFHHSADLINMPQTGMFRLEDGNLRVPKWSYTLSGDLLAPELEAAEDEADVPHIATPRSENQTRIMQMLFPRTDFLCLNFGRTAVFQWNEPNSSILGQTTEWPQGIAADLARENNLGGITNRKKRISAAIAIRHFQEHGTSLQQLF